MVDVTVVLLASRTADPIWLFGVVLLPFVATFSFKELGPRLWRLAAAGGRLPVYWCLALGIPGLLGWVYLARSGFRSPGARLHAAPEVALEEWMPHARSLSGPTGFLVAVLFLAAANAVLGMADCAERGPGRWWIRAAATATFLGVVLAPHQL